MTTACTRCTSYDLPAVRTALAWLLEALGWDPERPFEGLIRPGDTVFIKPNWVAHCYRKSAPVQDDVYAVITHPHVLAAVVEAVDRALDGRGRIVIGDNPSIDCDFSALQALLGLEALLTSIRTPWQVLDLRPWWCDDLTHYGDQAAMKPLPGDPLGVQRVELGERSLFAGFNPSLFRGIYRQRGETVANHADGTHGVEFSRSILSADVYISVPKLKTHHKTGTTLNLKGLVGTQSNKNLLVHWRNGFPLLGGDAYPSFRAWFGSLFTKVKKRGAWEGNDTIWRMVVDLYQAFNQAGPPRTFSLVDGITAGEGNGPFTPRSKRAEMLIAGTDLLETDLVATRLMGFAIEGVRYLDHLARARGIRLDQLELVSDCFDAARWALPGQPNLDFAPPDHWPRLKPADPLKETPR